LISQGNLKYQFIVFLLFLFCTVQAQEVDYHWFNEGVEQKN